MTKFYQNLQNLFLFVLIFSAFQSFSQVTTSSFSGKVKDSMGEEIPGATVFMVHEPTGTKYGASTQENGNFTLANLNPGGPYTLTVSFVGYAPFKFENINLTLGSNPFVNLEIKEETTQLKEVVVKAEKGGTKAGAVTTLNEATIKTVPTLNRSLTDITRLTPQGSSRNSFAGTNFRYNNVTVDGTINNDAIGFSPSLGGQGGTSGMPGSSTRTNPISLDAIQDIQVYVAPYDVKIGNFSGGSINGVTRTGTNQVKGSFDGYGRNAVITGPNNAGNKEKIPSNYSDYQSGFRLGFPIIKNKLFFFTNEEVTKRNEPIFYEANDPNALVKPEIAIQISDFLKSKYNFNPGEIGDFSIYSKSTKFFNRMDWNISEKHQLSIRNSFVASEATNFERDAANFRFSSMNFKQVNRNNSTVAELKSHFGNFSNSLILGYSDIKDYRVPTSMNNAFPQVEIAYNGGTIFFRERSRGNNL